MNPPIDKGIFIVGVRKCGTTTAYELLSNHSKVSAPKIKEPQFFCLSEHIVNDHFKEYHKMYDPGKILLDGSTLYYGYPEVYQRIKHYCTDPYFILCLRDPAKRMYSAFWHMKKKEGGIETRNFDAILDALGYGSIDEILEHEQTSLVNADKKKQILPKYLNPKYHKHVIGIDIPTDGLEQLSFFRYFEESLYSRKFSEFCKNDKTTICFLEDLMGNTEKTIREIHNFAGLEVEDDTSELGPNTNKSRVAKYKGIQEVLSAVNSTMKRAGIFLPQKLKATVNRYFYNTPPELSEKQYIRIRSMMTPEYEFWFNRYPRLEQLWRFGE